ncbi:hypothetical protein CGRA01v4_03217 [Colletotrichum graminicola]|nr:hypothetical protein CGRA01v4_03217 [Colletotrichum graminicola]
MSLYKTMLFMPLVISGEARKYAPPFVSALYFVLFLHPHVA